MSSELGLAAVVAATFLAFGYVQYTKQQAPEKPSNFRPVSESSKKNKRKKQAESEEGPEELLLPPTALAPLTQHVAVPSRALVPGGFTTEDIDTDAAALKSKKSKKRKGKKTGAAFSGTPTPADNHSEGSSAAAGSSRQPSGKKRQPVNAEQDESWMQVEPRRRQKPLSSLETGESKSTAELTSDAGVTTSVTGNSSPVTEQTEDEADPTSAPENRRTLAERILPKPRKTGVEE
jgi:hypothetical protein